LVGTQHHEEIPARLLDGPGPPGFDRDALMPQVDRQIVVFLKKHLLP
jgi:hypothetical protein